MRTPLPAVTSNRIGTLVLLAATAAACMCLAAAAAPTPAGAATFNVTRTDDPPPDGCDPGDCSLREAIVDANATREYNTIVLSPGKRYRLAIRPGSGDPEETEGRSGDLDVVGEMDIFAPGKKPATIDAAGTDRVFHLLDRVPPGCSTVPCSLSLKNLVVQRGQVTRVGADADGGGILVGTTAPLPAGFQQCHRAGVYLDRTTVSRNRALGSGGGIYNAGGAISMYRSTVENNHAGREGGGIRASDRRGPGNYPDVSLTVRYSTISGNRAKSHGGGIARGVASIWRSTIANNRSKGKGGGYFLTIPATWDEFQDGIMGSTIAYNRARRGAGIFVAGQPPHLRGTLVAANRLLNGKPNDCTGRLALGTGNLKGHRGGYNLIGTTGPKPKGKRCRGVKRKGHNLINVNPRIGKLRRNGGDTKTIALRKKSPAINASRALHPSASSKCRPWEVYCRDQHNRKPKKRPDIGALEYRR